MIHILWYVIYRVAKCIVIVIVIVETQIHLYIIMCGRFLILDCRTQIILTTLQTITANTVQLEDQQLIPRSHLHQP